MDIVLFDKRMDTILSWWFIFIAGQFHLVINFFLLYHTLKFELTELVFIWIIFPDKIEAILGDSIDSPSKPSKNIEVVQIFHDGYEFIMGRRW